MWVIISLSIAFANPERPFERLQDNLRQRNYAQLTGEGPVYGSKYGPIQASIFRDGIVQHYKRPLDNERFEVKRFSGTGHPLTRTLIDQQQPISVKVYGADTDIVYDVESWVPYPIGPIEIRAPASGHTVDGGTHRWVLEHGTLLVTEMTASEPFADPFTNDFHTTCRCVLLDRQMTWIDGNRSLRLTFSRPIESRFEYGTLWVLPLQDTLIAVQWVSASGDLFERPHATGRAIVALITGAN